MGPSSYDKRMPTGTYKEERKLEDTIIYYDG